MFEVLLIFLPVMDMMLMFPTFVGVLQLLDDWYFAAFNLCLVFSPISYVVAARVLDCPRGRQDVPFIRRVLSRAKSFYGNFGTLAYLWLIGTFWPLIALLFRGRNANETEIRLYEVLRSYGITIWPLLGWTFSYYGSRMVTQLVIADLLHGIVARVSAFGSLKQSAAAMSFADVAELLRRDADIRPAKTRQRGGLASDGV